MALMQYDRINFEKWVRYGPALVDKGEMEEAKFKETLSSFAARFVWAREVLEREKKFSFLARSVTRRTERRLSEMARQLSICEDVKKMAQDVAVMLGDKNGDEYFHTLRFSRHILSLSPRLSIKDIVMMNEHGIRDRVLY